MKPLNFLFSTRTMTVLLIAFALVMGVATFIEKWYGTPTAQAYIYQAHWFEAIMLLLMLNFAGNINRYQLWRREKWPTFLLHLSFIVMFFGGFVSRYIGFEGQMTIPEGKSENILFSRETFFKYAIRDNKNQPMYLEEPFILSPFHKNYEKTINYNGKNVTFRVLDYSQQKFNSDTENIAAVDIVTRDGMQGEAQTTTLLNGEIIEIKGQKIGFGVTNPSIVTIQKKNGKLYIQAPFELSTINMMEGNTQSTIPANQLTEVQQILYKTPTANFMVMKSSADNLVMGELESGGEKKQINFIGKEYEMELSNTYTINGLEINVGYGSSWLDKERYQLPFKIQLNDFQLENYPGSETPSSYASEVTVLDNGTSLKSRIFMNNVLDYKGYRFFQSSYQKTPNGESTVLSVNHDFWGTYITYFGYFLMTLAMLLTLVWKGSHFDKLKKVLNSTQQKKSIGIILIILSLSLNLKAQDTKDLAADSAHLRQEMDARMSKMQHLMSLSSKLNPEHKKLLARLLVQDQQGRIKPMDTHAREVIDRIHGSTQIKNIGGEDLDALESFMSLMMRTQNWFDKPFILVGKAGGDDLIRITKAVNFNGKYYTSPKNLTYKENNAEVILVDIYEAAFNKAEAQRTEFDKEVIKVVERLSLVEGLNKGSYFWVVPDLDSKNHEWNSWAAHSGEEGKFFPLGQKIIAPYLNALFYAPDTKNWDEANKNLQAIIDYQKKDAEIIPSETQIDCEILYNSFPLFNTCAVLYIIFGVILLALAFINLLYKSTPALRKTGNILSVLIVFVFILHTIGLGMRWYFAGHAPWSNAYEAIIFVAWATMLATMIFARRNYFIFACGAMMAFLLMIFTFITNSSPAVGNLVPVLKSYWLVVHVAVITSSYGFLGLSFIIGFVNLILMSAQNKQNYHRLNQSIKELTTISEMSLTIGLYVLSIGTFLGGVWANESWGRYWSWDPKETWALISMMVYATVAHMRLVPGLRGYLAYNLASIVAFSSIMMTFLGVNYFLSGMHSYGAGDPIPIMEWALPILTIVGILAVLAYQKNTQLKSLKNH